MAHVHYGSRENLHRLVDQYDVLEKADHEAGTVDMLLSREEYRELLGQGYRIEVDEAMTAEVNKAPRAVSGDEVSVSTIPGYSCYRTVEETYSAMSQLALNNPNLASWIDIGDSWEKKTPGGKAGYDMHVLVLTNKSTPGPKPRFFLMGAIHAREYTTAETTTRFAEHLVSQYNVDPDITWLLNHYEAHILFQANPDGRKNAEAGSLHRKNTNNGNGGSCGTSSSSHYGTDLNRNSSWFWGGSGSSSSPCNSTYRGPSTVSEPETQALEDYMSSIFPAQRGPGVNDPAPVTAEGVMGTSFFESCSNFENTIYPANLPALVYAFKAARRPYQSPAGPDSVSVAVAPSTVTAGGSVTLTATANDTRYGTNGGTEPSQNVVAARYSVNNPSWDSGTTTTAMTASDGAFNSTVEGVRATLSTAGWAKGTYTIFVESQDAAGNWGVPTAVFLTVQ